MVEPKIRKLILAFSICVCFFSIAGCGGFESASSVRIATLTWAPPTVNTDGSPLTNLAGYYIYYGTSPTALTSRIQVPDPKATQYVVSGLSSGTWYFALTAYTSTGLQSALSNVGSKTFP